MADVQGAETSQDFTDFIEHVSRNVKRKEGFLIGSLAELPMEYLLMRMEDICLDALQVSRDQCAVMAGDDPPRSFKGMVFQVEPVNARLGYARLRKPYCRSRGHTRYLSIDEITNRPNRSKNGLDSYEEDILIDFLGMKNTGKQQGSTGQNLFGLNNIKLQIQVAVTCLSWPKEAADWKTRQRAYGWPDQDLLENVVNGGCHLVPFQSTSSSQDSTVFRLSFACAEVALVYTWTPIQKHIYHVLRLIKGDVVRQLELHGHRNIVHAYHFKTLMLWACETKPPAFWDESRIKSSVGELLCEMIEFLVDRNCPNYFMPSVNLMVNLPEDLDVDAAIMPLLVFKEQGAARLVASIPIATPNGRSTIRISNKLMNLGQIGLRTVNSHAGYRRSMAKFCEEPTKRKFTYPMEFNNLFNGISAHLRLANSPHCSGGDAKVVRSRQSDYDMAVINLEQAVSAEIRTYTSRQISFGDALPELLGNIYFADENNPEMSLMRSTNIPSYTRDMPYSNGDISCGDTIPASPSNLSMLQASCMKRKTDENGSEDDSDKISSVSPPPSEQVPGENGKPGTTEGKALNSSLQLIVNVTINFIVPGFELMFPKASSLVSAAYRANFFYSHCRDYQLALHVCEESLRRFRSMKVHSAGTYVHDICSVVLTPKWMPIFDKHIQTVYGFVALSDSLNRNRRRSPPPERVVECRSSTVSEFHNSAAPPHYLSPLEFLDYIKVQCEARLLPFYENSCSRSSKRMFSSWCSMTCRSRFIMTAASRINNERPVTHSWNRAPPVWSTYSTHCLWKK